MSKYKKIVIGVDQSYTRTGISICADGKILKSSSTNFKALENRSDKRKHIRDILVKLLKKATREAQETIIICERIRTFSNFGHKGKKGGGPAGLKPDYLKMTGALIATIVDTGTDFDVKTYSVDTRSWKAQVVGSSKAKVVKGKRDAKSGTVNFVQNMGIDLFIRTDKNGKDLFDDDQADAVCMSLYGFIPEKQQKLKEEE